MSISKSAVETQVPNCTAVPAAARPAVVLRAGTDGGDRTLPWKRWSVQTLPFQGVPSQGSMRESRPVPGPTWGVCLGGWSRPVLEAVLKDKMLACPWVRLRLDTSQQRPPSVRREAPCGVPARLRVAPCLRFLRVFTSPFFRQKQRPVKQSCRIPPAWREGGGVAPRQASREPTGGWRLADGTARWSGPQGPEVWLPRRRGDGRHLPMNCMAVSFRRPSGLSRCTSACMRNWW